MSNHQEALNTLIDCGLEPSHAQAALALAFKYNCVHFPNLRPGPDSWGSHMELTVQCREGYIPTQYSIKLKEVPHY